MKTDCIQFLDALVSLLESGLPVVVAVDCLCAEQKLGKYAAAIKQKLQRSESFSDSLCSISGQMESFRAMITGAEESGNIVPVLKNILEEQKQKSDYKKSLITLMIYPAVIIVLSITLSLLLLVYGVDYINQIADINENQIKSGIGMALIWLLIAALLFTSGVLYLFHRYDFEYKTFKSLWYMNRACIGMEEALLILLKEGLFSRDKRRILGNVLKGIQSGKSFYMVWDENGRTDSFSLAWLYTAEQNGNILGALEKIQEHYEEKRKKDLETVSHLIEPAVAGGCGIYVLIIVIRCIVPIFQSLGSTIL